MHKLISFRVVTCALLLAAAAVSSGCARRAEVLDRLEERDPLLKRAVEKVKGGDVDGAIELYNKALDRNPALARAHLEVGLLYDRDKQDYIRAIYHYERYLELRPQARKKEIVDDAIRQARLSFAASLPDQPPGAIEHIAMLNKEIAFLKSQLAGGAPGAPPPAAVKPAGAPARPAAAPAPGGLQAPKPEPAQPAVQTYVVQSGDTLSSIATKVYKDPNRWKQIYDANRSTLGSPENVRVGQTLVIPR